jgi:hypothetical protein
VIDNPEVTDLRPGSRWRSAVCEAEVIVVRPPAGPVLLCIGGVPALAGSPPRPAGSQRAAGPASADRPALGTRLGSRYLDETSGLEMLCTRSGAGTITVGGRPTTRMAPRQLPASD